MPQFDRQALLVGSFRRTFLGKFVNRAVAANAMGNSHREIMDLLEPFEMAKALAIGADSVTATHKWVFGTQTEATINEFMRSVTDEAEAIQPEWNKTRQILDAIGIRTPLQRLSSTEADIGKKIMDFFMKTEGQRAVSNLLGRLLGAAAGRAVEHIHVVTAITNLTKTHDSFFNNIMDRFHRFVLPSFVRDAATMNRNLNQ